MLSVGLDLHKRYSRIEVIDEGGNRRAAVRLPDELSELQGFFGSLDEPCRVVLEAGWNWGLMHDWLDGIEKVVEVQLAHPYGVRAIAAAQVKTDRIDARTLAQLLRADLIPRAYVPGRETRQLRETVRQRLFLVRLRTMVKNRIHALLDRHHALVEAAWVAVRRDPYFRHQSAMRCRHKGSKTAIIAVARHLAEVIWHVLSEDRDYEVRQPISKAREYAVTPAALSVD